MWKGIDVSDNQGVIDWAKVAAAGVQFAVLRSVRRSGKTDHQFAANLAGCRAQGIPVSVYKYTYATTEAAATEEARQVVALLQANGLDCIVWWDVEDRETLYGLGRDKLTACIRAARAVIEAAGYRFGLYVGLYVYKEGWFDFSQFATIPLWVARYPSNAVKALADVPDDKYKPAVGRDIWGWQYTSNGRVPGISGNVDLDICYQDPVAVQGSGKGPKYYLHEIWHGSSISKALESLGEDGGYAHRQQIAVANGIAGYAGTADQNTHMLDLLRTGQLRMP